MTNPASQQPAPIRIHCSKAIYYKRSTKHWYHEDTATDVCEGIYTPEQEVTSEEWKSATPLGTPGKGEK